MLIVNAFRRATSPPVCIASITKNPVCQGRLGLVHCFLSKFTVQLNHKLLGYPFSAIVRIKPLPGKIHILQQRLIAMKNCLECDKVTGDDCFIARLVLKSIPELDEVLDNIVDMAETSTAIVKQSPVERRHPPLI